MSAGLCCFMVALLLYVQQCFQRTRYDHMVTIAAGITRFSARFNRLPASLDELAASGVFASESTAFACPPLHLRFFWLPQVALTNLEYELIFNGSNVIVRLPPKARSLSQVVVSAEGRKELEYVIRRQDGVIHRSRDPGAPEK